MKVLSQCLYLSHHSLNLILSSYSDLQCLFTDSLCKFDCIFQKIVVRKYRWCTAVAHLFSLYEAMANVEQCQKNTCATVLLLPLYVGTS